METFSDDAQPPSPVCEIPLNHNDHDDNSENTGINPLLLSQPRTLQGHQHGGQPHASGSTTHQNHHIPPADVLIPHDDAQYDPSTNPYVGMQVTPMPTPWQIPTNSSPQVQIPPQFLGFAQLPPPVNPQFQFQRNLGYDSSSVGIQMPSQGYAMPPLSPLPPSYDGFAFGASTPPSRVMRDDQVSETPDNTTNMEPIPIVPSQAHIRFAQPQPYLADFFPEFMHPILSQSRDALLPPDEEDESRRDPVASMENPVDDSTFRFYWGVSDRRGRKRKRVAKSGHFFVRRKNSKHQRIIRSAKREITKHALNKAALTEEADRVALADRNLEAAAKKVLEDGMEWASQNSGSLYMILSEPCKDIMKACKKRAFELVLDGFDLRLSIWSTDSELAHQETLIADLIDDSVFPPKFLMGSGTDDEQHFLENNVVLNVMLDTIRELQLTQYLEDIDSLACLSAVAVRNALDRVRHGLSSDLTSEVEFSGAAYRDLYTALMTYIEETVKTSPELQARWEQYKKYIKLRLAQY